MKKRILSLVVAIVMVFGMIPLGALTAFADTTPEVSWGTAENDLSHSGTWDEFNAALQNYYTSGGEEVSYVRLNKNVEDAKAVETKSRLTLDLAGHTIAVTHTLFTVQEGSELTVIDSAAENGTVSLSDSFHPLILVNGGSVIIEDGNFTNNNTGIILYVNAGAATVNGGVFSAPNASSVIETNQATSLTVNGGEFQETKHRTLLVYGEATVNGGTFYAGENGVIGSTNKLTITDGTFYARETGSVSSSGVLTITGGTFSGNSYQIDFFDGTIDLSDHPDPTGLVIYRSNYDGFIESIALPEGYVLLSDSNVASTTIKSGKQYTVGIEPPAIDVASVTTESGTTIYTDMELAFAAAASAGNATLTLLADVSTEFLPLIESGSLTLDLNGKTWKFVDNKLQIKGTASVKIIDSSEEKNGTLLRLSTVVIVEVFENAELEITSGILDNRGGTMVIDVLDSAKLTVSGGTLRTNGTQTIFFAGDTFTITDGTFKSTLEVIYYQSGRIDLSGHANPFGISIFNGNDTTVPISDATFKLPEGYTLSDEAGNISSALAPWEVYTVDINPSIPGKIVIAMRDSYGDGWNGAEILIYKNGEPWTSATIEDGNFEVLKLDYEDGAEYAFYWIAGAYDEECTYTIYVNGEDRTDSVLPEPGASYFTSISFNQESNGYDADTRTFVVTESTPLIITFSGENLDRIDLTGATNDPMPLFALDTNDFVNIFRLTQPTSLSATEMVITIKVEDLMVLSGIGTISFLCYTNNNQTVENVIPLKVLLPEYGVEVEESENGTVTIENETANAGTTVTLSVVPNEGYVVDTVTVTYDGGTVEVSHYDFYNYSFLMPQSEVCISATFRLAEKYGITLTDAPEGGTFTADGSEAYEGSTVNLSFDFVLGYTLDTLTVSYGDGHSALTKKISDTEYQFLMPGADVTVTVTFKKTAVITNMYVPEGTPGYNPVTKEFVITPEHPLIFVVEGENLDLAPSDWQIRLGSIDETNVICGLFSEYRESASDTKITFKFSFTLFTEYLHYIGGSYIGKVEDYFYAQQLSDVKLYYSYVSVKQTEGGWISVPHMLNAGDVAQITVTPNKGYAMDTLTIVDTNGDPIFVDADGTFTVPDGGAIVTATFKGEPHTCVGTLQFGEPATCESDGYCNYYQCEICEAVYSDEACTDEIEDLDAWKSGEGKMPAGHDYGTLIPAAEEIHTAYKLAPSVAAHYFCEECGTYFTEEKEATTLDALSGEMPTHIYEMEWKSHNALHWYECACGAKANVFLHSGGTATCEEKAVCSVCNTAYGSLAEHTPAADDGDCTTDVPCSVCDGVAIKGKAAHTGGTASCNALAKCTDCGKEYGTLAEHTPAADDGDCTTDLLCSVCSATVAEGADAHTGGTATCNALAKCADCGKEYGALAAHADTDGDNKCDVCTQTIKEEAPKAPQTPPTPSKDEEGLSVGAIVGIAIAAVIVAGGGGFAIVWFFIKKKTLHDLITIFKK